MHSLYVIMSSLLTLGQTLARLCTLCRLQALLRNKHVQNITLTIIRNHAIQLVILLYTRNDNNTAITFPFKIPGAQSPLHRSYFYPLSPYSPLQSLFVQGGRAIFNNTMQIYHNIYTLCLC